MTRSTRTFIALTLMFGGFLAIALPASAEDGGQYRHGGNGIISHQGISNFQR